MLNKEHTIKYYRSGQTTLIYFKGRKPNTRYFVKSYFYMSPSSIKRLEYVINHYNCEITFKSDGMVFYFKPEGWNNV